MAAMVECVPNFSEGRSRAAVDEIVAAICAQAGVRLLDVSLDADHNRSVVTFVGPAEAVGAAAIAGAGAAAKVIDLRTHQGEHPRMGATDVIPFIPLGGTTMAECVSLSRHVAEELWARHRIPSYLYEESAASPGRRNLATLRKGQFEGLSEQVPRNPDLRPDVGEARVHPSAGITAVGARHPLIAFNVNLATTDLEVAKAIAREVRESTGGFPAVKAMGFALAERGLVQVSMNMTRFEVTGLHTVFDAIARKAQERNIAVVGSEIVGLVPMDALVDVAAASLKLERFDRSQVLERRLL